MLEYRTSNLYISYPFIDGADGLDFDKTGEKLPLSLFVDAAFDVYDSNLRNLYLLNCFEENNNLIFNIGTSNSSIISITVQPSNSFYTYASAKTDILLCRLLFHTETLISYINFVKDYGNIEYGLSLPFLNTTQTIKALQIDSISIYNKGPDGPCDSVVSGDVKFLCGHNIALIAETQTSDDIGRDETSIELFAQPGAGLGRIPYDHGTSKVKLVSNLFPFNKNIQFVSGDDECYTITPYPDNDIIFISGRCFACCTCQDYIDVINYLKSLFDKTNLLKDQIDALKSKYNDGITKYNQLIAPNYLNVSVSMTGFAGIQPNWVRVIITFVNKGRNPVEVLEWDPVIIRPISDFYYDDISWSLGTQTGKALLTGVLPIIPPWETLILTLLCHAEYHVWELYRRWRMLVTIRLRDTVTDEIKQFRPELDLIQ